MNSLILGTWILAFFGTPDQAPPPKNVARQLDFVSIAVPGNPQDKNGYGRVTYTYRITRNAIDNEAYAGFLNAADSSGANSKALYNPLMGSAAEGGITFDPQAKPGEKYAVKPGMAKNPVYFVSWPDAARMVNWLSNGGQRGSSTEIGVYNLRASKGQLAARVPAAHYAIANPDELYKAAYYLPTGLGKTDTDEVYASGRGAITLATPGGVVNELVDPLQLSQGKANWVPENASQSPGLSFAGAKGSIQENGQITFHLVSMDNSRDIADEGADDQQYAGAPSLDNTGVPLFFPSSGGGGIGSPVQNAVLNVINPLPSS